MAMQWYPLKLTAHVRSYAFGARLIPELLGKQGLPEGIVAETWEISDYGETVGTVRNGAFAGRTLHDVTLAHPDELVGPGWRGPHFPLLCKFLDASHELPVHLHADDETARRVYGAPNGKTEAWHILWAAPGASILAGVKPGVTREQLIAAFKAQDYDAVMPRHPIAAGDTIYVPGCTLHSFGPDTLIFEVQQTSDLAQHVMPTDLYGERLSEKDWERGIAATLDELKPEPRPVPDPGRAIELDGNTYSRGAAGPFFVLERWRLRRPHRDAGARAGCLTVSNVGQPLHIAYAGGRERLGRGESCVLPAAIGELTFEPEGEADLVVCALPGRL